MIHFQHLRRRKYFAVADFICVGLAVALAFYIRTKIPLPVFSGLLPDSLPAGFESFWIPASVLGLLFMFMQYAFGVYDLWHSSSTANWLQRVLPANLALIAGTFSCLYLSQNANFFDKIGKNEALNTGFWANRLQLSALSLGFVQLCEGTV
jgi:hypothetical protein